MLVYQRVHPNVSWNLFHGISFLSMAFSWDVPACFVSVTSPHPLCRQLWPQGKRPIGPRGPWDDPLIQFASENSAFLAHLGPGALQTVHFRFQWILTCCHSSSKNCALNDFAFCWSAYSVYMSHGFYLVHTAIDGVFLPSSPVT